MEWSLCSLVSCEVAAGATLVAGQVSLPVTAGHAGRQHEKS